MGVSTPRGEGNGTHSSTLAWKIPWTEEPGRLQSMGSQRVVHDWATALSLFTFMHWRRKWQPTPVFLPGESQGWWSLWGRTESDTVKWLSSSSSSTPRGSITPNNHAARGLRVWLWRFIKHRGPDTPVRRMGMIWFWWGASGGWKSSLVSWAPRGLVWDFPGAKQGGSWFFKVVLGFQWWNWGQRQPA